MYHTGALQIPVYSSEDLVNWRKEGVAFEAVADPRHWAQIDLWAPEVVYENGTFYMYLAAAMRDDNGRGNDGIRRIGAAVSSDPCGPFIAMERPLTEEWSIDAHPFKDEDGVYYLYYNVRNRYTTGPGGVIGCGNVVDRMIDMTTLAGNPTLVVRPDGRHEGNKEGTWYWNEGPFVLKRGGTYYQMYSSGFFGDDTYRVSYATSPVPIGRGGMTDKGWAKRRSGKSVLGTTEHCQGPGHHVVVQGPNGVDQIAVYHGYSPGRKGRKVRIDRLYWSGDRIIAAGPTTDEQPLPSPPGFCDRFVSEALAARWRAADGEWQTGQGVLVSAGREGSVALIGGTDWRHAVVQASVRCGPHAAGIWIQSGDGEFRFSVMIDPTARCARIRQQFGDVEQAAVCPLWPGFDYAVYHELRLERNGTQVLIYVDQRLVRAWDLTAGAMPDKEESMLGIAAEGAGSAFAFVSATHHFHDDLALWPAEGSARSSEAGLFASGNAAGGYSRLKEDWLASRYEMQVSLRLHTDGGEHPAAGIYAAYFDQINYVFLYADGKEGTVGLRTVREGIAVEDRTLAPPGTIVDGWNHFRVRRVRGTLRIDVNAAQIAVLSYDTDLPSRAGIRVEKSAGASFGGWIVTELPD